MTDGRDTRRCAAAVVACTVLSACGAPTGVVTPEYHAETGELTRLTLDEDGDGRPEMTAVMEGAAVRVVEVDEDGDGRPDRWEYFASRPSAAASGRHEAEAPRLLRVERLVRDGRTRRREAFEHGELVWAREDRDGDGRDDRWETYEHGGLVTVEIDSDGSGRPDRVMRFSGDRMTTSGIAEDTPSAPADAARK